MGSILFLVAGERARDTTGEYTRDDHFVDDGADNDRFYSGSHRCPTDCAVDRACADGAAPHEPTPFDHTAAPAGTVTAAYDTATADRSSEHDATNDDADRLAPRGATRDHRNYGTERDGIVDVSSSSGEPVAVAIVSAIVCERSCTDALTSSAAA